MYERFTDRARRVMQLANQEAQRLNHEYVGVEHLLLGLVKEGAGIAANVLKNMDVDLRKIRLEVEKVLPANSGEPVSMGRLPHTPRAKQVIEGCIQAARDLNHNYIGTEHILISIARQKEGPATDILKSLGITDVEILSEVSILLGTNKLIKQKLNELTGEQELAVSEQDFEKAQKMRQQIQILKGLEKELITTKEDSADNPANDTLHKIACTVLLNYVGGLDAETALEEIRILLK